MLDHEPTDPTISDISASAEEATAESNESGTAVAAAKRRRAPRKRAAPADQPAAPVAERAAGEEWVGYPPASTLRDRSEPTTPSTASAGSTAAPTAEPAPEPKKTTRRRRKAADSDKAVVSATEGAEPAATAAEPAKPTTQQSQAVPQSQPGGAPSRRPPTAAVLFLPPEAAEVAPARPDRAEQPEDEGTEEGGKRRRRSRRARGEEAATAPAEATEAEQPAVVDETEEDSEAGRTRRRRGRRGRGRGKGMPDEVEEREEEQATTEQPEEAAEEGEESEEPLTRRRRRRRRKGAGEPEADVDDGVPTVVRIREPRAASDEIQGVSGSTRLEAKRQRRRDGREQRRTRPPILTESEFLARREAVDRVMAIRESQDRTQIAVLEDGVLVEHYVTKASASTMVGNVYLGKVQNVLPSMEAAFVDLGRGRNAVLYAGEVNWDAAGLEGKARSIEQALKSGDSVLVQVTKDPIGHKGARLTSHIALSGRHLVYVPNGNASGISRKLSDVERKRLRDILKKLVPEDAGVIVRTAAEGASEEDLSRDVTRLQAQWEDIGAKAATGNAPSLLYAEPDLVVRVVRDLFNEDFKELVIQGDNSYDTVETYLGHVSPDLVSRVHRYHGVTDVFATYRIDEQLLKGLDRKVFLPSGGSLVIDRTEAMTVIDVNTGKYTGAGGNLEETVTRNNLEAAEEIVRQLRLRDIGGIIVIDFIDMVLESNRELVLRRLTECLGRDRTKHQVTEITSLGLVQMTRKRIGAGLLEAFSEPCEHCKGRGVIIHTEPVSERRQVAAPPMPLPKAADLVPKPEPAAEALVDTEGYDLSRYETADADEIEAEDTDESDEDDSAGGGRRRSRRGGRRRTRP